MSETPKTSTEHVDLEATLQAILRNAVKALGGSAGVVATWNETERRFVLNVSYGLDAEAIAQFKPLLNETLPDLATSRESFNLLAELRPDLVSPSSDKKAMQNPIIALPLQIGGKLIGLIYVLRAVDTTVFSRVDQSVLAAFANQAAIAVQNAKLANLLAQEKHRVELILESNADGIISIDAQRRLIGFNQAMERLTGYSREEVLGRECFEVLYFRNWKEKNLCQLQCPFLRQFDNKGQPFEYQGKIRAKDGRDIDVSMLYSFIRSPEDKLINAVVNVRDISKVRQLEDLRETFLSMLGHELQTPLSIIKGYSNTLSRTDGKWSEETLRQGLQVIEAESDRLSRIMDKLLLASRISAGVHDLKREPVQLPALARQIVNRLQVLTNLHIFGIDFEPGFPLLLADPELIEEVLTNLLENAVKYSPEGGKVTISGKCDNRQIHVTVSDEGIGIPARETRHIFERFHRVDKGLSSTVTGVGLGLYICKTIIEAHGGTIQVSSQPGKGSQFTFSLPSEQSG
jgi:PAS domain S-box-containing protein